MIGKSMERLGQSKLALPYFQRAVELDPADTAALMSYGVSLASMELFELAEPQFIKVLQLDPEHSDAHYNLGVLYAVSTDRTGDAMHHLERAFMLDEENEMARYAYDMIKTNLQ